MARIGINGFGRIGRMTMRAALLKDVTVVMINDPHIEPDYMAYMFKYDSTHGTYGGEVSASGDILCVDGQEIRVTNERNPRNIPWGDVTIDYVVDCSGLFFTHSRASLHLEAGAKKVVVSAPSVDVPMFVMGVNHTDYTSDLEIVSNSSCTTHCVGPLCKVLHDNFGIKEALMTSVHSVTAIQKTVDGLTTKQCRGGRGGGQNIISCITGTAKAVGKIIPDLQGKITGMCFRVPTANVSVVDLTVKLEKEASYELIKDVMKSESEGQMYGIIGFTNDEIVSSDVCGETFSCFFDASAGISLNDTFVKLIAWYDNEVGYAHRMVDLINYMYSVDKMADADSVEEVGDMPEEMAEQPAEQPEGTLDQPEDPEETAGAAEGAGETVEEEKEEGGSQETAEEPEDVQEAAEVDTQQEAAEVDTQQEAGNQSGNQSGAMSQEKGIAHESEESADTQEVIAYKAEDLENESEEIENLPRDFPEEEKMV